MSYDGNVCHLDTNEPYPKSKQIACGSEGLKRSRLMSKFVESVTCKACKATPLFAKKEKEQRGKVGV